MILSVLELGRNKIRINVISSANSNTSGIPINPLRDQTCETPLN